MDMITQFKLFEQTDDVETRIINDMISRCENEFLKYVEKQNHYRYDDMKEKKSFLDNVYDITVKNIEDNYVVSFWGFTNNVHRIIGNNPVLVYHFTSSNLLNDILKEGLVQGKVKTNPFSNSYSGVYLTTQNAGTVINSYVDTAIRKHGGKGVQLYIKKNIKDLEPDPDDIDLRTGKYQFITDHVLPREIIFHEKYVSTTGRNPFI
jgi:hypothetical protein